MPEATGRSLHRGGAYHAAVARPSSLSLQDLLACPACLGKLDEKAGHYRCLGCGTEYQVVDGIPVFADEKATGHDELDHLADAGATRRKHDRDGHKAGQAAWFDRAQHAEFEIERPTGTPAFYRFLLREKFRRAMQPLGGRMDGRTALAVCGGSGMDAELLAGIGAIAISSDISLGAARRVQERARRHGVSIVSIVADVERLPFRDRSVDLVYVHDGLHHLADPELGLREMARVAAHWVSITEPARAAATQIAVRLGIALDREESGNVVARLEPALVEHYLRETGFRVVRSQRYAMYYRHFPGRIFEALSRPGLYGLATTCWRVANVALGRVGNKLAVVAERRNG